jgi:phosphomannomutase
LDATGINAKDACGGKLALKREQILQLQAIVARLESFFTTTGGFGRICSVNYTDGVRIRFENGDVAHVRPSGNADELRLYAVANSPERVEQIAAMAVAPDGILRRLLKSTA